MLGTLEHLPVGDDAVEDVNGRDGPEAETPRKPEPRRIGHRWGYPPSRSVVSRRRTHSYRPGPGAAPSRIRLGNKRRLEAELPGRLHAPRVHSQLVRVLLRRGRMPRLEVRWELHYELGQCLAFLLAAIRLGIAGKQRFEYRQLLLWTAFRRLQTFVFAVTFASYGCHSGRTCQSMSGLIRTRARKPGLDSWDWRGAGTRQIPHSAWNARAASSAG